VTGVRSLEALATSASTSRVLNLNLVEQRYGDQPEHSANPFFRDTVLNRSILIKHRLRSDEKYMFQSGKSVVTKIVFPFDKTDLGFGGQSVIVEQPGYRSALAEAVGSTEAALDADFLRLAVLDVLPSLDPFLVREQLRRNKMGAADFYFSITESDTRRMLGFASSEISDLIRLAFGAGSKVDPALVKKLAEALLSTTADTRLEPLRLTLGLQGDQFREGVFSWKGFLYYKWQFQESAIQLARVRSQLEAVRVVGKVSPAERNQIDELKTGVKGKIAECARGCAKVLGLYDDAFRDLVDKGNAAAFRKFLLEAPTLFIELGHRMGVVSHIASYWGYRFKPSAPLQAECGEFIDLLQEFDLSLASDGQSGALAIKLKRDKMMQAAGMVA
jgi:hypothetical protein